LQIKTNDFDLQGTINLARKHYLSPSVTAHRAATPDQRVKVFAYREMTAKVCHAGRWNPGRDSAIAINIPTKIAHGRHMLAQSKLTRGCEAE
jgi:hypothetical protein